MPDVTVAIPVRDGGELFAGVLRALATQTVAHELLVCDSRSRDHSGELARAHGARVIEIDPAHFSHGGTRNLLMNEAAGTHVALLTQDAEPADAHWLEHLLAGFDVASDVGLVCGPYLPRPDASTAVGMELERWFGSLAPDGAPRVDRLEAHERETLPAIALIGARGFFTDANACIARAAWQRAPFRRVPYAEDRLLAIDMLRAGYARAYVPDAPVLHSHAYSSANELRRCFDEWRGLREIYGWREPLSPAQLARRLRGELGWARRELDRRGAPASERRATLAALTRHHVVRLAGSLLGSRADRLPAPARGRISLEGRSSFEPLDLDAHPIPTSAREQTPTTMSHDPIQGRPEGAFSNMRRRIYLTYTHFGLRTILWRLLTFPLRFTPLHRRMRLRSHARDQERRRAATWYREHGSPVDVVIPSYRDAAHVRKLVRSIHRTTARGMARVIVADDASGPEHLAALRAIDGIDVLVEAERNSGFAANVNRGLRATLPERDVVVLNSDVEALEGWLEGLQYAAYRDADVGIVGAQLLYSDGRIQFGGTVRNRDTPEWFDHRYRFKPGDWGPAAQTSSALAVTGACMYVRRKVIERVGMLDERYPMAYEDVDWCLRAWQAGFRVRYFPIARLVHHESLTRGTTQGERELDSQRLFWERWSGFFDDREVCTPDGRLRVVYVTEDTGIGGGHRDIFEHLNRLADRGHDVSLFTLGDRPEWFDLRAPVCSFSDYDALAVALAPLEAIKVATWWMTAPVVWRASVARGIPVYFVQDIETSYYPDHENARHAVLDSYRPEFRYMTISAWNRERLRELGLDAELIPPGIDLETFRPRPDVARREDMVLALGRSNPLKNLPLTLDAWRALSGARPELCLFGIEPELASDPGMRYVSSPDDEQVNELFCQATVFVQTSIHEGFALPPLEAMAGGAAVVCTDAHGNRDFCRDGINCLMPEPNPRAVSAAIARLLGDPELRARLGQAGVETAGDYAWERRIDALEDFYARVSRSRSMARAGEVLEVSRTETGDSQ